jgi:hypothetical protein
MKIPNFCEDNLNDINNIESQVKFWENVIDLTKVNIQGSQRT